MQLLFSFRFVFIGIFIFLATGMLCSFLGFEIQVISSFGLGLGILFFAAYIFSKKSNILYFGGIQISFMILGYFAWQLKVQGIKQVPIETVYEKGDLIQLRIHELGDQNADWRKVVGEVIGVQRSQEIIPLQTSIVVYIENGKQLKKKDVLIFGSELERIENPGNPGEFDAEFFWNSKGIYYQSFVPEDAYRIIEHGKDSYWSTLVERSRNYFIQILDQNLDGSNLAIARALILGDKSMVNEEIRTSFTVTGAMHVLAVSGLHIGIIMQILLVVFSRFSKWISKSQALTIIIGLMWFYAAVTGLSPSVLRAVFMFTVLSVAKLAGRNYEPVNVLFFTGVFLILVEPSLLLDIGFQLSFLAMLGIYLFYEPIEKLFFIELPLIKQIWQGTAIGFAAQIATTPLSLYYFHQFPNYFILTNIGLMASSGLILGGGILLFVIYKIPFISKWVAYLLGMSIALSFYFIQWVQSLPGAVAYGFSIGLLEVFILFVLAWSLFSKRLANQWKYLSLVGFIVLLSSMVWTRLQAMNREELVIFNAKKPLLSLKQKGEIHFFHGFQPEDIEKVKFIAEGYQKIRPGDIFYHSLTRDWNVKTSKGHLLLIKKTINGYIIRYKQKNILLRTRYTNSREAMLTSNNQLFKLNMAYMDEVPGYNLKEGSITFD